jgi:hypothetical protein
MKNLIRKILKEEIDSDWGFMDDINSDLKGVLGHIFDGSPYDVRTNVGDSIVLYSGDDLMMSLNAYDPITGLPGHFQKTYENCKRQNDENVTYSLAGHTDRYVCDYYKDIRDLVFDHFGEKALTENTDGWDWAKDASEEVAIINTLKTIPETMSDDYPFHTIYVIPKDLKNIVSIQTDLNGTTEPNGHYDINGTIEELEETYVHIYQTLQDATELFGDVDVNSVEEFKEAGSHSDPFYGSTVDMEEGNDSLYRVLRRVIPNIEKIYTMPSGY